VREENLQNRTAVSAGLHRRLRQTASLAAVYFFLLLLSSHSRGRIKRVGINVVATDNKLGKLTTTRLLPLNFLKIPSTPSNTPPVIRTFLLFDKFTSLLQK
jgi:hypothetical protein